MNYLLGGLAVAIILHIYYRIGRVYLDQVALSEKLEALDEVIARGIAATETALLGTNLQRKVKWRVVSNPSNDDGGAA